jgi:orotidine-5'-phosphate decarboxylase
MRQTLPSLPVFCALDTPDLPTARRLAGLCADAGAGVKLGLEFFSAHGSEGVRAMVALGAPVFLDLKFHDIPNTVQAACREAARLGVALITVHAAGGAAMVQAARQGVREGCLSVAAPDAALHAPPHTRLLPRVLAVTVLTSLQTADLAAAGITALPEAQVLRLAQLARAAGVDGVVCSGHELSALRQAFGSELLTVVPGIRPAGTATADQKRTMTPTEALKAGADYLVIGRPITASADPAAALAALRQEIERKSGQP